MDRWAVAVALAVLACSAAMPGEQDLDAGFRSPPAESAATKGWFLSPGFADGLKGAPEEVRIALERALADGGLAATPEAIKRMAAWQALHDAGVITKPGQPAARPQQPYEALTKGLDAFIARLVFVCRSTSPEGGVFTQSKPAHGIAIYPPPPSLYLARRTLGDADVYLAVSQAHIDTVVTITFPRLAGPEIWDPEDGSIRDALTCHIDAPKKQTMLNLRLGPYGAAFIVLRKPPSSRRVTFASSALEIAGVADDGSSVTGLARVNGRASVMFANGTMGMTHVAGLPEPLTVESGWTMATRTPARRQGVGIVTVRIKRANADEEKRDWASPAFDDSGWAELEIGKPEATALATAVPWQASWLAFEGNNEQRLFRKTIDLPEDAAVATVTLTADNGYELFVNGQRLGADGTWNQAETYDAAKALRKGKNVLAVRNTNQGSVGGLLLEARIRLASGKVLTVATDETWKMTKQAPDGWQKPDFDDGAWDKPSPKGKPPVAPWGDVPGLPAPPKGGQVVWYRFRLPAGAKSVRVPTDAKGLQLFADGRAVAVRGGAADLSGSVPKGPVVAALRIAGMAALERPILVDCGEGAVGIGNWLLIGYPDYSGIADYRVEVALPEAFRKERLVLDLGDVGCAAQVAVNGRDLGTRLWRPYMWDITDAVRSGPNAIAVTVANTAANASGTPIPADRLAAGILGPVRIRPLRKVTLQAQ